MLVAVLKPPQGKDDLGEPTGLVPRASGDKDGSKHRWNHTKYDAIIHLKTLAQPRIFVE